MRQFKFADDWTAHQALDYFRHCGRPFRTETTGSSITLISDKLSWVIASERFQFWHLAILSKVKAEVRRNAHKVASMPEGESDSFSLNITQFAGRHGRYKVDELDLVGAYVQAAKVLGLLSDETVARLNRLPKRWRLRILGAIATRRRIDFYDSRGVKVSDDVKMDAELRHCWFCIVGYVDRFNDILKSAVGAAFVFSWYDNFYARAGALTPRLQRAIGLQFRLTRPMMSYRRVNSVILATIADGRRFFLPAPNLTR